ncbi:hypothetical protein GGTG_12461 [Gaeumannomyces tritici R3-111a-1]|uniref:Uncharacterized protein n=1 Tax=Gaeumannomyces tritici (strain R3-111a-1) TaxID=644352 RepID=J3PG34_GAET3|nr:hypothetical protein GGTG_12461 [Gaeumannomyces tritici R3-111a-1]EJT70288.1 hypothetical protein GGTG_12461 [Gaeumannomyces tritici R3-111a-1]
MCPPSPTSFHGLFARWGSDSSVVPAPSLPVRLHRELPEDYQGQTATTQKGDTSNDSRVKHTRLAGNHGDKAVFMQPRWIYVHEDHGWNADWAQKQGSQAGKELCQDIKNNAHDQTSKQPINSTKALIRGPCRGLGSKLGNCLLGFRNKKPAGGWTGCEVREEGKHGGMARKQRIK